MVPGAGGMTAIGAGAEYEKPGRGGGACWVGGGGAGWPVGESDWVGLGPSGGEAVPEGSVRSRSCPSDS
jgi:hypothetical protein